jgi:GGDEF domain-containing protein
MCPYVSLICLKLFRSQKQTERLLFLRTAWEKIAEINTNAMAGRDDLPPYKVGASIGVAFFPEDGSSVESLIHKADERMYQDKMTRKAGR